MRRAVVVVAGVLLAFLTATVALGGGLLAEAAVRATPASLLALAAWVGHDAAAGALRILWIGSLAACLVPVSLAAIIGEAAGLTSVAWYGTASGALAAAVPTVLRATLGLPAFPHASPAEARMTLLLFLAGAGAGVVYWLAGGRTARRR